MRVEHHLIVTGTCPVDHKPDRYEAVIECTNTVKVEDIVREAGALQAQPMFQEDLTQALARALGAKVTTIGYHSGVKTICEC